MHSPPGWRESRPVAWRRCRACSQGGDSLGRLSEGRLSGETLWGDSLGRLSEATLWGDSLWGDSLRVSSLKETLSGETLSGVSPEQARLGIRRLGIRRLGVFDSSLRGHGRHHHRLRSLGSPCDSPHAALSCGGISGEALWEILFQETLWGDSLGRLSGEALWGDSLGDSLGRLAGESPITQQSTYHVYRGSRRVSLGRLSLVCVYPGSPGDHNLCIDFPV